MDSQFFINQNQRAQEGSWSFQASATRCSGLKGALARTAKQREPYLRGPSRYPALFRVQPRFSLACTHQRHQSEPAVEPKPQLPVSGSSLHEHGLFWEGRPHEETTAGDGGEAPHLVLPSAGAQSSPPPALCFPLKLGIRWYPSNQTVGRASRQPRGTVGGRRRALSACSLPSLPHLLLL